jgi:hypothetical protein
VEREVGVIMSRGDELIELLLTQGSADADAADAAGELVSQISAGYPVESLGRLLHSGDPAAAELGAWVASELGGLAAPLLPEIASLLDSDGKATKFFAIDVVLVCAGPEDGSVLARAVKLIEDPDKAVRWKAMQLLSRSAITQLEWALAHMVSAPIRSLTQWLARGPDQADITARLADPDRTTRLFAAAAAARAAWADRGALEQAAASRDAEVSTFADQQLEVLAIRQQRR